MKGRKGQIYSPVEKYRAKLLLSWLEAHHPRVLNLLEPRTVSRWRQGSNTIANASIYRIAAMLQNRPGLGGKRLAAEFLDLFEVGPCDVPLWSAMEGQGQQLEHEPPSMSQAEQLLWSLCQSAKWWHQAASRFIHLDRDGLPSAMGDDEKENKLRMLSASLRCSLKNLERASTLPSSPIPFRFVADEVAQVMIDQMRATSVDPFSMIDVVEAELMQFEARSLDDDLALMLAASDADDIQFSRAVH